ncbi:MULTISPECIES: peptidoglycan recognition protein family protein [unclassified Amycolatopsis]|uniref:peptidoglycan recognition protein family protein n=1 Tax=unclassified Amycolatopsis TaxID=2618356 RepID=UPI002E1C4488|nr:MULTISPECIES: N-acetylmuramoyl-L-alanine amidase [unclassified Amycolatopsis]
MYVPWLVDAARSTGYPVVEVAGWQTRGHGGMRVVEGVVGHHTATADSAPGDYPSLDVVTNGRPDLAGPLCNLGLGRSGTIYVVAAGCAYHAGASRWLGFLDLNDEFLGIEAESAGNGVWTDAQRDAYPKLVAALLRYMSRGVERYAGHKDVCVPAGRKIDPVGIDTGWLRQRATTGAPGTTGVEILERITVTPPDAGEHTVRVFLSGSPGSAIVVRPRLGGDGSTKPMWVPGILAWGSDHTGIGHNPAQTPGYDPRLTSHRRYEVPGAVWADLHYSAAEPFDVDLVG